jgi:hypothetical protein
LLPHDTIQDELERLKTIVQKTAGQSEHRAFEYLVQFITPRLMLRRPDDLPFSYDARR